MGIHPDAHTGLSPTADAADFPVNGPIDLTAIRARLAQTSGRQFWRSLEELADSDSFRQFLEAEFPREASILDRVGRRQFLQLMGASLAFAGLSACTKQPVEKIVPYVKQPEEIVPGVPLFYATAMPLDGYAMGVLVESHMGRPTKIEGNPEHPASLGATDALAQGSVLGLYDPDRSQVVRFAGEIRAWPAFGEAMRLAMEAQRAKNGAGLRILTGTVTSPTLAAQLSELLGGLSQARWHQYDPVLRDSARAGAVLAFGSPVEVQYRLENANVIVSLEGDFLGSGPGRVRYIRDFSGRRRVLAKEAEMSRLYVVESTPSITGSMADHRQPVRAQDVEAVARQLAAGLGLEVAVPAEGSLRSLLQAMSTDLLAHRGKSVVIAGDHQPAIVHALAHAMNATLGNVGQTVLYTEPVAASSVDQVQSLRELVADMDAGKVEMLVIVEGNPVFDAPADLHFGESLQKVALRVHLGSHDDETSWLCHWHVPAAHYLESWSDARAFDGTVSIIQPLIAPLYAGKTAHEVVAALAGRAERSSHDLVRDFWKAKHGEDGFDRYWRKILHDGIVPDTALPPKPVAVASLDFAKARLAAPATQGLEIVFRPDPSIYDGRFANNGWLQELPKPITKLTWDNVAMVSPATAERLGLQNEAVVELRLDDRAVRAPVWITPGQASDSIAVCLGYGRTRAGRVGSASGFDAYRLRASTAPWFAQNLQVNKSGETYELACSQGHFSMEGRGVVRTGTLEEYRRNPHFAVEGEHEPGAKDSMYAPYHYDGYAWGMAIDLNACVGCNACVVACVAENNISVVGKDQVRRGREMQWIRIDRYFAGDLDNPEMYNQPVLCQHCELAPCEVVCPVKATVHDDEGLNDMVYNRCVGTKYCSNNCPYKVRRFNFHLYSNQTVESLKLVQNPDVTVRTRGVMEKCTYCVQRINLARIDAKKAGEPIRDGAVLTACQQACPAEAIVFGNINDPASRVAAMKAQPRNYRLLGELNTRPRTTYLAGLRNPNPALAGKEGKA